tara:strand:+ start:468 stop:620 length:153 start_codon:yes stop_codon:yes gene_type:complete
MHIQLIQSDVREMGAHQVADDGVDRFVVHPPDHLVGPPREEPLLEEVLVQ